MYGYAETLACLEQLGIEYRLYTHAPVMTVAEADAVWEHIEGRHCKCLFLKDKKKRLWLVTAPAELRVDLKALSEQLGCQRLNFASPELLLEHLGVLPGAVTPLAIINDRQKAVTLVLDEDMLTSPTVNYHPMVNTATVALSPADLLKYVAHAEHDPVIVPLSQPQ